MAFSLGNSLYISYPVTPAFFFKIEFKVHRGYKPHVALCYYK